MNNPSPDRERDFLLDHNYDGICEYDNPLPGWWTWIFIATIAFSIVYYLYYHATEIGADIHQKYETQMVAHISRQLEQLGELHPDDATILEFTRKSDLMNAMSGVFRGTCAQCHAADGGGGIGPNLTDNNYLHVKTPKDIYEVISNGWQGTSMPAFKDRFREPQRILLAAYVASLRGTAPAQPKAPQGESIAAWPAPAPDAATETDGAAQEER